MRNCTIGLGAITIVLASLSPALGQQATERYIPLGQSPGLSAKATAIGPIAAVDANGRVVTLTRAGAAETVRITDRTQIWLDRTKLMQPNAIGQFGDLKVGQTIEVRYAGSSNNADWIKVEMAGP